MGLFRPSRARREGPDPFLLPKMTLFVAAAVVGAIGMATERAWLVIGAVALLAVGLVLRLIGSREQ